MQWTYVNIDITIDKDSLEILICTSLIIGSIIFVQKLCINVKFYSKNIENT